MQAAALCRFIQPNQIGTPEIMVADLTDEARLRDRRGCRQFHDQAAFLCIKGGRDRVNSDHRGSLTRDGPLYDPAFAAACLFATEMSPFA